MSGWQQLGSVLGGGIDREGAHAQGLQMGAQTQNALAQARVRQMDEIKKRDEFENSRNFARAALDLGLASNAQEADALSTMLLGGAGNLQQIMGGRQTGQTMGFRQEMAAPETDFARAQRLRMAAGDPIVDRVGTGQGFMWDRMSNQPLAEALLTPQGEAQAFQREQAGLLSQARREDPERFRAPPVSISFGGQLGDEISRGTVLPDVSPSAYPRATGVRGFVTNLQNLATNLLTGELSDVEANEARQAMEQLASRTRAAGRILMGISQGRITDAQMRESGVYAVDPTDVLRGDRLALSRAQSTLSAFERELQKQNLIMQTAPPTSAAAQSAFQNALTIQDAIDDYRALIEMFNAGSRRQGQPEANPYADLSDEALLELLRGM